MRIAHISDLHFGTICLSPLQFFSKRWMGNFNFFLNRKKTFAYDRLIDLIDLFKDQGITHVFITGDITVTSRRIEYKMGKRFVELLKKEGIEVFVIPGNHDHYTRRSYRKKSFYRFFTPHFEKKCPFNLKDHGVTYTKLADRLWLVGLDTTLATGLFSAQGHFSPTVEENLEKVLKTIPKDESIILLNHFPLFHHIKGKNELVRAPLLKKILNNHPNIILYLHGHTHLQTIADLRQNDLPIISDSGSTPHIQTGSCHLFELSDNTIKLDVFRHDGEWKESETHQFKR